MQRMLGQMWQRYCFHYPVIVIRLPVGCRVFKFVDRLRQA